MKCPKCKIEMINLEGVDSGLWVCEKCRGQFQRPNKNILSDGSCPLCGGDTIITRNGKYYCLKCSLVVYPNGCINKTVDRYCDRDNLACTHIPEYCPKLTSQTKSQEGL